MVRLRSSNTTEPAPPKQITNVCHFTLKVDTSDNGASPQLEHHRASPTRPAQKRKAPQATSALMQLMQLM
ncbi:hypothetical protein PC128_g9157 [Phytophthora cactorum]|nr:hypothetical protein PC128_g9157 [Phytophthora cactorum]